VIKVRGQQWRRKAVCYLETPDAPELWTPARRPPRNVRVHLEQMCQRCPVQRQCAAHAVLTDAETGMYAGVYVPNSREPGWAQAMQKLRQIAGLDQVGVELAALGASA